MPIDPNLIAGAAGVGLDDAAVYRLRDDLALVFTTDFFTPIVDDPYDFGAIAAANALSDVYAMGGKPLLALNLVAFPIKTLPLSVLSEILRGGAEKLREAGIEVGGGHSIDDAEPKFGMAIVGTIHPDRIWRKAGARPGDALILTKALGTGIVSTAIKKGIASVDAVAAAVASMKTLNRAAADVLAEFTVHAATDVTGFGLVGHLHEMASAGKVSVRLFAGALPILPGARELAEKDVAPGGTRANIEFASGFATFDEAVAPALRLIACDAQTSGGLLAALPAAEARGAIERLKNAGLAAAAQIGEFGAPASPEIRVLASSGPPRGAQSHRTGTG